MTTVVTVNALRTCPCTSGYAISVATTTAAAAHNHGIRAAGRTVTASVATVARLTAAGPTGQPSTSQVPEDDGRRRPPARTGDAAARMRGRPAEVEAAPRAAVPGPLGQRPQREHCVQRHLQMHDVAAAQPQLAFEVERGLHPTVDDRAVDARRPFVERVDQPVALPLADVVPVRAGDGIR